MPTVVTDAAVPLRGRKLRAASRREVRAAPTQFFGSAENFADVVSSQLNCACLNVSLIEIFIFLAFIKLL
ncbi:MAG: hypothetical protein V7L21_19280 [Nostoc sp.]|uniref:hypothetical protein n=1 Tax=Nostoc sp. TaxID=1180 RepID=UPI002FF75AE3